MEDLPAAKALRRAIEHAVLLLNINLDTGSRAPLEIISLLSQLEHMAGLDTCLPQSMTSVLCRLCNQRTPLQSLPGEIPPELTAPFEEYEAIRAGDFSIVPAAPIAEILQMLEGPRERVCEALSAPLVLSKEVDEGRVDQVTGMVTMGLAAALTCVTLGFGAAAVLSAGALEAVTAAALMRAATTGVGATAISSGAVAATTERGRALSRKVVRPFFVERTELNGYMQILRALLEILPQPSPRQEEETSTDSARKGQEKAATQQGGGLDENASLEELEDAVGERFSKLGYDGWDECTIRELIARLVPAPSGNGKKGEKRKAGGKGSGSALDERSLQRVVLRAKMLEKVARLRHLAEETKFVVVIGPQNAGKSTLIKGVATAFGRPEVDIKDIGFRLHTTGVGAYEVHEGLWMVDFPGCNSISEEIAESWQQTFTALPCLCLLVVRFAGDVDKDAVRLHAQIRQQYPSTEILVVINQVDLLAASFSQEDLEDCKRDFCEQLGCPPSGVAFTVLKSGLHDDSLRLKGVWDSRQLSTVLSKRACPLPVSGCHGDGAHGCGPAAACTMSNEDALDRALGALYDPSQWSNPSLDQDANSRVQLSW